MLGGQNQIVLPSLWSQKYPDIFPLAVFLFAIVQTQKSS